MSFKRLALPIRKYIREKGWDRFHPIQAAAFDRITNTSHHYILASKTASGKTEAAFLPVLTFLLEEIENQQRTAARAANSEEKKLPPGIRVIYISPLIALINDQLERIEEVCRGVHINITRWHSEADREQKKKLLAFPQGILFITPESIESLFVNHSSRLDVLFSRLQFIIVDEIHSFLGTLRGCQLQSLLHRIAARNIASNRESPKPGLRFIGLSATLGDFEAARAFFGDPGNTRILRDTSASHVEVSFKYYENTGSGRILPGDVILDIYQETRGKKTLIFPNSRGRVEELAVKLKKVVEKLGDSHHYFAHHSSISKELREHAEHFAKHRGGDSFGIICTSTLELGIDIGMVDLVVQVDSTFSVASLVQRFGRSGRRQGEHSSLLVYALHPWSLLQSLACIQLFREGFSEPVVPVRYPIDILFQQILSILEESGGTSRADLIARIQGNHAFASLANPEVEHLVDYMIAADFIEDLHGELIIGYEAEKIVHHRSFYSVFQAENSYKVIFRDRPVGELTSAVRLQKDQNIYLAARMWKIIDIDDRKMEIFVIPAEDGKRPVFSGSSGEIHPQVREKMLEILTLRTIPSGCNPAALAILNGLRKEFSGLPTVSPATGTGSSTVPAPIPQPQPGPRPVKNKGTRSQFYTFTGTRINRTLELLFKKLFATEFSYDEINSSFNLPIVGEKAEYRVLIRDLKKLIAEIHFGALLEKTLQRRESAFHFSKWGGYLPLEFKKKILLYDYFDCPGTAQFLDQLEITILSPGLGEQS